MKVIPRTMPLDRATIVTANATWMPVLASVVAGLDSSLGRHPEKQRPCRMHAAIGDVVTYS